MTVFESLNKDNPDELSFESIFEKAANDIAYRPLFYRKLLDSDLFLLTQDTAGLPERKFISDKGTTIQVRFFSNGIVPVFTSTNKIFDNNVIKGEVYYTALNAKIIFETFNNETSYIINPYSPISKELLADEIKSLLNGNFYKSGAEQFLKPNEDILLGVPADYPINLIETLKRYFRKKPDVKGSYLALIENKSKKEFPHLLLGVDCKKDSWSEISGELAILVRDYLKASEIMDFIRINTGDGLSGILKKQGFKIY